VKIYTNTNETRAACRGGKARAFTLIQLVAIVCIIAAMTSIVLATIRSVTGKPHGASEAQMKALAETNGSARWAVTNHNANAVQADRALELLK
jgi:hypothetical protein